MKKPVELHAQVVCEAGMITVEGALDMVTAPRVLEAAQRCFDSADTMLTVDLGKLRETDSAALAVLLEWQRVARRKGKTLRFVAVPVRLRQLAEISELENVLDLAG